MFNSFKLLNYYPRVNTRNKKKVINFEVIFFIEKDMVGCGTLIKFRKLLNKVLKTAHIIEKRYLLTIFLMCLRSE